MKYPSPLRSSGFPAGTQLTLAMLVFTVFLIFPLGTLAATKYRTLHRFKGGKDGVSPLSGLTFDSLGNLYGTTVGGGVNYGNGGGGTVFRMTPRADGAWEKTVIHAFRRNFKDGFNPYAGLVVDGVGNLYGTTAFGGTHTGGTVFRLSPDGNGGWSERILHSFKGDSDGAEPLAGLVIDSSGNLYGTTAEGGTHRGGTVFMLSPQNDDTWKESILHRFPQDSSDGYAPRANLVRDTAENIYGTTSAGGEFGDGTVFELAPDEHGNWMERIIHQFHGTDGAVPLADVVLDTAGDLYGTTFGGGKHFGVVFQLVPQPDGSWIETVLHSFTGGRDGGSPQTTPILNHAGDLFGTTAYRGTGFGIVFQLSPASGGKWKEHVLHTFQNHPGARPLGDLIFDAVGNLYGTTSGDASSTSGSVFEIAP